jgi:hypothetical protein
MWKNAIAKFMEAKPLAEACGGGYRQNFEKAFAEADAACKKMMKENDNVYMDGIPKPDTVPKPDPQSFVRLISIADELNKAGPLDNQFRHLVPPIVRQQQDELQKILQGIIQQEFTNIQKSNE